MSENKRSNVEKKRPVVGTQPKPLKGMTQNVHGLIEGEPLFHWDEDIRLAVEYLKKRLRECGHHDAVDFVDDAFEDVMK